MIVDSGLSDAERAIAVQFATGCLGDAYDLLDIASFAANLLTDGHLILGEANHYICSALIYRSYQEANATRFPAEPRTISPNDFGRIWKVKWPIAPGGSS